MPDNHHEDICQNCGKEMNKSEPTLFHERHLGHIKAIEPDSNTIWSCGDCIDDMYPRKGTFTFKEIDEAYGAKFEFKDGVDSEHMWVNNLTIDGNDIIGTLDNDPVNIRNVRLGQSVTKKVTEIEDLYFD